MPKFKVEIIETLSRVVDVEANCIGNAIEIVERKYNNEKIVLDSDDFIDLEVKYYKPSYN